MTIEERKSILYLLQSTTIFYIPLSIVKLHMHFLLKQISDWLSYFRAPSETLMGVWFEAVWKYFDGQEAARHMQYAGWYQTPDGIQLFPLPDDGSVHTDQKAQSEPLYRVRVLPLPKVRMYQSVFTVNISQTTMVIAAPGTPANEEVRELEILVEDTLFAHNLRRIHLRRTRHITAPVWERYTAEHAKTHQPVSLHEIILMKSIVDAAVQLDTHLRAMVP